MQSTNHILMIQPVSFCKNEETSVNNTFQKIQNLTSKETNRLAQKEFEQFVETLIKAKVTVTCIEDTHIPHTPDSIFPNNWVSFHRNGNIGIYPIFAPNRRHEKREDIFDTLYTKGYHIEDIIDYSADEENHCFLEGTGSFILDREHEIAYCGLSERSDEDVFIEFCEDFGYFPVVFNTEHTNNGKTLPVYHTNVMLSIASHFVVICLDVIPSKSERNSILKHFKRTNKKVINITIEQMNTFCGNVLELKAHDGELLLVMSTKAFNHFTNEQKAIIGKTNTIIHSDLSTIESYGGGSARCMIAEVFLNKN